MVIVIDWGSLLLGFALGCVTVFAGTAYMLRKGDRDVPRSHRNVSALMLAFVLVSLLSGVSPTLAQTPVPLEIPTDVIFTETNNWIATFAPIAAIGIGITIALAVLAYLGKMIAGAFRT
jgi:hypothetical protein